MSTQSADDLAEPIETKWPCSGSNHASRSPRRI